METEQNLIDALLEVGSVYRTKEEATALIKEALTPFFDATATLMMECLRLRMDCMEVMDNPTLENKAMASRTIKRLREYHTALESQLAKAGF